MTTALLGGLGLATRTIMGRIKTYGDWMIQSRTEHTDYERDILRLQTNVSENRRDLDRLLADRDNAAIAHAGYERELQHLARTVPQEAQNLAVLASEVEAHLRWHERNPGG